MKYSFLILAVIFIAGPAQAAESSFTPRQLERLQYAQAILAEVDTRSAHEISDELNQTAQPEGHLQIHEAVAATYQDLVTRKGITALEEKKDLYKYIRLNVAFIQFGGDPAHQGDRKLNQWIRQTLTRHLPKDLLDNPQLFYSADQWNR